MTTSTPLATLAESLFEHIKHGDDEHRAWLKRESLAWCEKVLGTSGSVVSQEARDLSGRSTTLAAGLSDARIVEIRDECLPSQGETFDCIAFARAIGRGTTLDAAAIEWIEEALGYTGCETWSPSLTEQGVELLAKLRATAKLDDAALTEAYEDGHKDGREEWAPLLSAIREVLRISDRKHVAWDRAYAAIDVLTGPASKAACNAPETVRSDVDSGSEHSGDVCHRTVCDDRCAYPACMGPEPDSGHPAKTPLERHAGTAGAETHDGVSS